MTTLEPTVTAPPSGMNVGDPHCGGTEKPLLLVELAAPQLPPPELREPDPELLLEAELLLEPDGLPLPLDPEPLALPLPDPEPELLPSGLFGPELEPDPLSLASTTPLSPTSGTSGNPMRLAQEAATRGEATTRRRPTCRMPQNTPLRVVPPPAGPTLGNFRLKTPIKGENSQEDGKTK
jgi:hypothetical protein